MAASMHRVLLGVFVLCTVSLCWFLYALHSVGIKQSKLLQQATTMPQNAFFQLISSGGGAKRSAPSLSVIEADATAWLSSHQLLLVPAANGKNNSFVVKPAETGPSRSNWLLPPIPASGAHADASVVEFSAAASSSNGGLKRAQFVFSQRHHQQQQRAATNNADYYESQSQTSVDQPWLFDYAKRQQNSAGVSVDAVDFKNSKSPPVMIKSSLDAVSDHSTSTARTCPRTKGAAQHIVFAKTHKCGSSTVQSILLRYAEEHNFHIAFPKPKYFNYYVPFPRRFRADAIYDWGVDQNEQRVAAARQALTTTTTTEATTLESDAEVGSESFTAKSSLVRKRDSLPSQRQRRSIFPPKFLNLKSSSSTTQLTTTSAPFQPNYNLMCFHSRFDYDEARRALPQPDTLFITIVRDPVAQFESIYTFYRLGRVFANATFEEFVMQPETYTEAYPDNYVYRSRNPMMFDYGLDPHLMDNGTAVMAKILEIERQFDLILVADLMDESLVLLRDLLCWDWRDMVAFRKNTRMNQYRLRALNGSSNNYHAPTPVGSTPTASSPISTDLLRQQRAAGSTNLPPQVAANTEKQRALDNDRKHAQKIADAVRRWNWADQMLYDHFSAKLRALLAEKQQQEKHDAQQRDSSTQSGVDRLRRDRQAWMNACVSSESAPLQVERMFREYGGLSSSFQLRDSAYSNRTCVQLALPELQFIKQLFAKQHPILPEITGR